MKDSKRNWWADKHRRQDGEALSGEDPMVVLKRLDLIELVCQPNLAARHSLRILDVGVGTGVMAKYLTDLGHEVIGIDICGEAAECMPGSEFCHVDSLVPKDVGLLEGILRLGEFRSYEADIAICHLVAQHCTNEELAHLLKQLRPHIRPGGVFAIQYASFPVVHRGKLDDGFLHIERSDVEFGHIMEMCGYTGEAVGTEMFPVTPKRAVPHYWIYMHMHPMTIVDDLEDEGPVHPTVDEIERIGEDEQR